MSKAAQLKVISHDIADDCRRRLFKVLKDRAARMQESPLEARLTDRQTESLWIAPRACLAQEDSLRIYTVPDSSLPNGHAMGGPGIAQGRRYRLL